MRTETLPEWKRLKPNGRPLKGVRNRYKYEPTIVLIPRSGLFRCPKCIGGKVKEEVDDFQLVLRCVNCGWEKCSIEPEVKHYREVRGNCQPLSAKADSLSLPDKGRDDRLVDKSLAGDIYSSHQVSV